MEHLCIIIFNMGQWFMKQSFQRFSIVRARVQFVYKAEGNYGESSCDIILNLDQ